MWRGANAVGDETLSSRSKTLTDIAENKSSEMSPKDIVSKNVTESVQNVIGNFSGCGRKRDRGVANVTYLKKRKKAKLARVIKRYMS